MTIEVKTPENHIVLDHEKLNVYQVAIEFVVLADEIIEHLPRGRAYLSDQLQRAALSIPTLQKVQESMQLMKRLDFIVWPNDHQQSAQEFWMCVNV